MKRVLITGATGFVGAAATRLLVRQGYDVAVLVRPGASMWRLEDAVGNIRIIHGDIAAPGSYDSAVEDYAADTVMHLAWQGVGRSRRDDPAHLHVNVCGSVALLRCVLKAGCRTFIGAGSQAEYGPAAAPVCETSPTQPRTLYGASKLAAHAILSQMCSSHGARYAWLRLFSVYGPQDAPDTLVSELIRDLLVGRRPAVTQATQRWDYLYVEDAARAFIEVALSSAGGVFNVGSGLAPELRESILCIRDHIDPLAAIGFGERPVPSEPPSSLQPRVERLKRLTAWRPRTSFRDGIAATIAYHRRVAHKQAAN